MEVCEGVYVTMYECSCEYTCVDIVCAHVQVSSEVQKPTPIPIPIFLPLQVEHTQAERRILQTMKHPFLMNLRYAFQNKEKLYFVLVRACVNVLCVCGVYVS
jgi:hypothetical protein